ncbi:hypothetical protein [Nonomuraea sp. NPDC023979]|uniref:hypothetical protein n=1 Tax=Nonomuraea sp. NPDC023979 TaxID=3154796 RepID=UPI00340F850C
MTSHNRYPAVCELCNHNIPAGEGVKRRELGVRERGWTYLHADCAPAYDEIARWLAAAARAEMTAKGRNPDRLDDEGLVEAARISTVIDMMHLFPGDGHRRHVHKFPVWDLDSLPSQGWEEYPAPGLSRVFIHPEKGVATVHPVASYTALNIPEWHIPRSNTTDGEHVVICRIGEKSVQLAATILAGAASVVQEQNR